MTDGGALFSAATEEQWEKLVRAKANDPEAPLVTELEDGLSVKWLYTAADALPAEPTSRGPRTGTPWAIRQQVSARSRAAANAEILEQLEGGATELLLTLDPQAAAGIPALTTRELEEVLAGVHLNMAGIALDSTALTGDQPLTAARSLLELFTAAGHDATEIRGSLGLTNSAQLPFAVEAQTRFTSVKAMRIDTGPHVDAGAGVRDELALAMARGAQLLRAGDAAGLSPAQLARTIEFTLIASADQFLEIAKFRAARRLWAKLLDACGVDANLSTFYARTSRRMMSSLDPWVNILRSTTATFAAGVGGADGVTVVPFDEPYDETLTQPGALGRRIARNTQLLLLEESHLDKVSDPAAGSWYIESLTEQLAQSAWARFQEIETRGGIDKLAHDGTIATDIALASDARHHRIATRQQELTGVNTFPLLGDDGLEREPAPPHDAGRGTASPAEGQERGEGSCGDLPAEAGFGAVIRDGAQFEHLRARAAGIQPPPQMLLACTGPLATHVAIAQWAKNFFESGGIETIPSGVQADEEAHVRLLAEHGLIAAAICPGTGSRPEQVAALKAALQATGARVYVAGEDVSDGVDMVAVLSDLLDHYAEDRR